MVQLKDPVFVFLADTVTSFQFRYGTIKSRDMVGHCPRLTAYFNSAMVQLKGQEPAS